jgi:hypothetical protein
MDARLILVLAALLVGTSGAPPTKLEAPERFKRGEFQFYNAIPGEYQKYVHLVDFKEFSVESDCKQSRFQGLSNICAAFGPNREYCDQLAVKFVEKHRAECEGDLRAVLSSSIGKDRLKTIEDFEAGLADYIKTEGLEQFPSNVSAIMFAVQPNRSLQELISLGLACKVYLESYDRELSFFEKSREETLKRLAKPTGERGLVEAIEDCKGLMGLEKSVKRLY